MKLSIARSLAACAVFASTVVASAGASVNAGVSLKTYTDSAHYVTFQYPANWDVSTKVSDITAHAGALGIKSGVTVSSHDGLAVFAMAIKPSLSTANQERADATLLMKENVSIHGAIAFTNLAPQYGPRLGAKAEVQYDAQREGIELIVIGDENKKKTAYAFEFLSRKPMAPDSEARQLANVFTSLVVG